MLPKPATSSISSRHRRWSHLKEERRIESNCVARKDFCRWSNIVARKPGLCSTRQRSSARRSIPTRAFGQFVCARSWQRRELRPSQAPTGSALPRSATLLPIQAGSVVKGNLRTQEEREVIGYALTGDVIRLIAARQQAVCTLPNGRAVRRIVKDSCDEADACMLDLRRFISTRMGRGCSLEPAVQPGDRVVHVDHAALRRHVTD